MSRLARTLTRILAATVILGALLLLGAPSVVPSAVPTAYAFDGVPAMPRNSCNDSTLPQSFGTNFPTPTDPNGFGYPNQSAIGWDGNYYPPFAYLSGAFFARGVPTRFTQGSTTYCGAMYSFSIYTYNLGSSQPPAGSVQWTMGSGYLPALTTSFTRNNVAISITNFANKVTIGSSPFELVYSRVSITNNGTTTITLDPGASSGLAVLANPSNTLSPGQSANHDYVVAVDNFGTGAALPSGTTLTSSAPNYDTAYSQMSSYWNGRLNGLVQFTLPNLTLPNTGLGNPGTALVNAFKANFIYNNVVQVGKAPFSGANNYAWLLNHDLPHMLVDRLSIGDYQDAQNLLLTGRASELTNFNEFGANWYWDGVWKTPWAWAVYLAKTGDTAFVSTYFNDTQTQFGPSLQTLMHEITGQLNSSGYLKASFDNDSTGTWLFDDFSALVGLGGYKYIASRLGNTTEANWADTQMTSLTNAVNTALAANQSANNFHFLPCEVNVPMSGDRCNTRNDANWASAGFNGQDPWEAFLMGVNMTGIIGDPTQIDGLYAFGFNRLNGVLPYPTMGGYSGYSTADNTGYADGGLYGNTYRDLPITSYAWQIQTTTGGPNAWWEANGSGPNTNNPWAGSHAPPQFGAVPYAWPLSAQSLALLRAIAAEGFASTGSGGNFTFTRPLYIGRGIPNTWIAAGQTIGASNLTSAYDINSGARTTYGVSMAVTKPGASRVITVNLSGTLPGGTVYVQLPIFFTVAPSSVTGGTYDTAKKSVTVNSGATQVVITLNEGGPTPTPTLTPTPTVTPTPSTGPIVYYKFDETSGTIASDASGNGKTATLVGGATWAAGRKNNAVSLSGSSQYVSLPAGIVNGLNNFTIAAWVNARASSNWIRLFDFGSNTTTYMFLTPQSGSTTVRFAITTSGAGGEQQVNRTGALTTGAWHFVVMTQSGNTATMYIDGAQAAQNTSLTIHPASLGSTTNNYIGKSQYSDPYLNGSVDEFRIYNRALSATEVNALYTNP